ncbi:MAG: Uma2 family endonuclease, partial [Gemmatimonadetes bacterium]|nr:Uma2 family endonuclease [Gemmatimonadota bacterium]
MESGGYDHGYTTRTDPLDLLRVRPASQRREPLRGHRRRTLRDPCTAPRHELGSQRLNKLLINFVDDHELGWVFTAPIDVLFAEGDYMEPDLVFVRRERRGIITDRGIEGPPDLIVEITSGSTAERDRGIKRERYAYF